MTDSRRPTDKTAMDPQPSVLFVCVKNAGKSQMATGLMRKIAGNTVRVYSAGTKPGDAINNLSAQSLAEVGIDITAKHPNPLSRNCCAASMSSSRSAERPTATPSRAPGSSDGRRTSPLNAESTASNACAWSAMTSPCALPVFTPNSKRIPFNVTERAWSGPADVSGDGVDGGAVRRRRSRRQV
jgi:Low molecular weight phosphotyrosine protein phosphatase